MTAAEPSLIGENRVTVGRVTDIDPTSVTIDTPGGVAQRLSTTPQTVVVKAAAGAPSDVVPGARVVVKYTAGTQRQVAELVVLATDSLHGLPVVEATADSITIRSLSGESVTVDMTEASVDKTSIASLNDVAIGSMIFVRAKLAGTTDLSADEIIVLPVDTVFGS